MLQKLGGRQRNQPEIWTKNSHTDATNDASQKKNLPSINPVTSVHLRIVLDYPTASSGGRRHFKEVAETEIIDPSS